MIYILKLVFVSQRFTSFPHQGKGENWAIRTQKHFSKELLNCMGYPKATLVVFVGEVLRYTVPGFS